MAYYALNCDRLKRVNPATAWSTRPSSYVKRHMFSPLTQRHLSAVNQLVNAPLPLRVDSGLSAPGPGPPAARSSSPSSSSVMMHPLATALPAPSQRLKPARIAAGWIAAGSGPSHPSRPGSMLKVRQMSAGLPFLPFSHRTDVAVQAPLQNWKAGVYTNSHLLAGDSIPLCISFYYLA